MNSTGMAYKFDSYNDNTPATKETSYSHIPGALFQDEFKLSDKWSILSGIAGISTNIIRSIFAPRLNVKWAPNPNTSFRWNAGTGFRVVSFHRRSRST